MQQSASSSFRNDAFAGQAVLVTGAAMGVGRAIAIAFAAHGARVAVNDIEPEGLGVTIREITERGTDPGSVIAVPGDIASAGFPDACMAQITAAFGSVDVLVNNAAVISEVGPFAQVSPASVERDIRIGLLGTMNMCRAALPLMSSRRFGRIVNIA